MPADVWLRSLPSSLPYLPLILGMESVSGRDEWELSKENVLPVKRGRSAAALSDTLTTQKYSRTEDALKALTQRFEDLLAENLHNALARLGTYESYLKWICDQFPSDSVKRMQLLERCTYELKSEESLRNEIRFVKMWIEYV